MFQKTRVHYDASLPWGESGQALGDSELLSIDIDGDGNDEVLARSVIAGDIRIRMWTWNGSAYEALWEVLASDLGLPSTTTTNGGDVVAGDFDGDGDIDVAVHYLDNDRQAGTTNLVFFEGAGDGAGGYALLGSVNNLPSTGTSWRVGHPFAADVCAGTTCPGSDGIDDVVIPHNNHLAVYNLAHGEVFIEAFANNGYLREATAADADGDGVLELVGHSGGASDSVSGTAVQELDGTTNWFRREAGSGSSRNMAAADLNGDGATDVAYGGAYGEIYVVDGTTARTSTAFCST